MLDSLLIPFEATTNGVGLKKFLRKKPQTDSLACEETLINMNGDLSLPAHTHTHSITGIPRSRVCPHGPFSALSRHSFC